jgi:hypothetical protein
MALSPYWTKIRRRFREIERTRDLTYNIRITDSVKYVLPPTEHDYKHCRLLLRTKIYIKSQANNAYPIAQACFSKMKCHRTYLTTELPAAG